MRSLPVGHTRFKRKANVYAWLFASQTKCSQLVRFNHYFVALAGNFVAQRFDIDPLSKTQSNDG